MADETTAQTPAPGPEGNADGQTVTPEGVGSGEQNQGLVEARDRYRSERDAAREQVARFQLAEVERLAAESLAMPGDLFSLSGNTLADYLGEDGNVDPDKVAADVAAIVAERPGLLKPQPIRGYDPSQGRGGREPQAAPVEPKFADLFKRAEGPHWGRPPRQ